MGGAVRREGEEERGKGRGKGEKSNDKLEIFPVRNRLKPLNQIAIQAYIAHRNIKKNG